jgi:GH15 family glucan-1,4-alpha-glucosidase
MRSAALVGRNGSLDWLCLPRFDSPSVFAALLDDEKGGHFQIAPADVDGTTQRQLYWPESNVLVTRFLSSDGVAELTDYMPVADGDVLPDGAPVLVRRAEMVRGEMKLRAACRAAFDYARADTRVRLDGCTARFESDEAALHLTAGGPDLDVAFQENDGTATLDFTLRQGQSVAFSLFHRESGDSSDQVRALGRDEERAFFNQTLTYWRDWIGQCTYEGRWREQVHRSALVLKMMTYAPTGAIVAAPTCSLPETIGGERNWDYRYTWMRDAAFTVYAFLRLGFTDEAGAFIDFLKQRCDGDEGEQPLQIVYGIDGRTDLPEEEFTHLEGYRGSAPVRIGNGAADQFQLDIYGELFDAVYLSNKYRSPIAYDFWTRLRDYADWVAEHWDEKDNGIWEMRGPRRHFVYSKLMCWVALDRALRLAEKRSFPAPHERWRTARDAIYSEIMERGWSDEKEAFRMHYDVDALDASTLIMPLVFFMSPSDPRMVQTLETISKPPSDGGLLFDSLVYRYDTAAVDDGVSSEHEGTFNMCSFWLVEAMTRAGRTDPEALARARMIFEKMLGYSNHLGLYAEETGACGEALGNFPQAFTHLSLISAAFNLDRTLDGRLYGKLG